MNNTKLLETLITSLSIKLEDLDNKCREIDDGTFIDINQKLLQIIKLQQLEIEKLKLKI